MLSGTLNVSKTWMSNIFPDFNTIKSIENVLEKEDNSVLSALSSFEKKSAFKFFFHSYNAAKLASR